MKHEPALIKEVLEYLDPKPNENFIDCTLGGGGHASAILERTAPAGKLLGIDASAVAVESLKNTGRLIAVHDNFKNLKEIVEQNNFRDISGILLDLGVSSMQLDDPKLGFSFNADMLDMRMDKSQELTAEKIVNEYEVGELIRIFRDFGQERLAIPIAKKIEAERDKQKIEKPSRLVEIVKSVYGKFYKRPSKINPATKIFQALRIAVNNELENLEAVLPQAAEILKPKGRLAVISFHSLEDRVVKQFFKLESRGCVCPPEFPVCQCSHKKTLIIITKKPITPSVAEINKNPRARSAKLRVAEKI